MGSCWTSWFFAEINVEVLVDFQATVLRIAVHLQEIRPCFGDLGVELVIPRTIERVGDVEPLAIKAELKHLRTAIELMILNAGCFPEQATAPNLPSEFRMGRIADIVLANIAMEPVREVEIPIIH